MAVCNGESKVSTDGRRSSPAGPVCKREPRPAAVVHPPLVKYGLSAHWEKVGGEAYYEQTVVVLRLYAVRNN